MLPRITAVLVVGTFLGLSTPVSAAEIVGVASYYGAGEPLNENTAMNIPFDVHLMECASWEYPLGAVLEVTSLRTGKSVIVRCTDRGPARRLNRLIDLTRDAFASIDDPQQGLTTVRVRRLK